MEHINFRRALPKTLKMTLGLFTLAGAAALGHAQGGDPHAVLDKGVKATGLTGADVPAWHMKANYTLYDPAKGSVTETGTFEEWSTGPWAWRRTYTEKKNTGNEWSTSHAKQFRTKDNKLDVTRLDHIVAAPLTDPLFQAVNYKPGLDMSTQAGKLEDQVVNCVMAVAPAQAAGAVDPDMLFPRMCFDVNDSSLKFMTTSTVMSVYSNYKPFGPRQVANKIEIKPYNRLGTALEITLLEPLPAADQAQVTPPGNAVAQPYAHQTSDAPLVPVKITECEYSMDARNNQERGMVMAPIVIKKDGSVKANGPANGPPHLSMSMGDCVGNWKFEPFKLDGEAIDVSDTVLYNFDGKPYVASDVVLASQPPPAAAAAPKK